MTRSKVLPTFSESTWKYTRIRAIDSILATLWDNGRIAVKVREFHVMALTCKFRHRKPSTSKRFEVYVNGLLVDYSPCRIEALATVDTFKRNPRLTEATFEGNLFH